MTSLDETRAFIPLRIAVLTISTRQLADDQSGDILVERLGNAGHKLAEHAIVTNDIEAIRAKVAAWIGDPEVDVVVTTGGTGFTSRDVTLEAVEPLFEKRMDGFSIIFHGISYEKIVTSAIQSHATAGAAGDTYIFCVPGSPGACKDAWDGILSHQLDFRTRPSNFVEIMPWLDEGVRRNKTRV
jgi:molybdenum cofactor biosynthesis protein B